MFRGKSVDYVSKVWGSSPGQTLFFLIIKEIEKKKNSEKNEVGFLFVCASFVGYVATTDFARAVDNFHSSY